MLLILNQLWDFTALSVFLPLEANLGLLSALNIVLFSSGKKVSISMDVVELKSLFNSFDRENETDTQVTLLN